MKLTIVDGHTALLPLMLDSADAALLLRAPRIVHGLRQYFELLWLRATPWHEVGRDRDTLTPTQRRVLELLAAGFTDEAIARKIGVTSRTVRRHVAAVLVRLGAPTRFAAGVVAQQRGWLPPPGPRQRGRVGQPTWSMVARSWSLWAALWPRT